MVDAWQPSHFDDALRDTLNLAKSQTNAALGLRCRPVYSPKG